MTPLEKYYKKLNELDLPLDINQKFALYDLACDLAKEEWSEGFAKAKNIFQ
jgi:hypothetical protein